MSSSPAGHIIAAIPQSSSAHDSAELSKAEYPFEANYIRDVLYDVLFSRCLVSLWNIKVDL